MNSQGYVFSSLRQYQSIKLTAAVTKTYFYWSGPSLDRIRDPSGSRGWGQNGRSWKSVETRGDGRIGIGSFFSQHAGRFCVQLGRPRVAGAAGARVQRLSNEQVAVQAHQLLAGPTLVHLPWDDQCVNVFVVARRSRGGPVCRFRRTVWRRRNSGRAGRASGPPRRRVSTGTGGGRSGPGAAPRPASASTACTRRAARSSAQNTADSCSRCASAARRPRRPCGCANQSLLR